MTTLQASSPTENMLLAENEQLRQKCAKLEQKVKLYEPDTKVIDGLCDMFANDTLPEDTLPDFGIDWCEISPFGGSSFGDVQRSSSLSSYFGTLDASAFLDDDYGDDLLESISLPSLGRSLSSSCQANLGTPRPTDENHKANANVVSSPANVFVKMEPRDIGLSGFPCAHGEAPFASPKIPMVSRAFLSRLESPRPKLRKISPEEGLPLVFFEEKAVSPETKYPAFLEEKIVLPQVQRATLGIRETKENNWWDVVLSPEQRHKHENWVHKKKSRVKYGTAYVYKNKREIAKARTRSDGKFQKTGETISPPTMKVALSKRKRC